MDEFVESHLLQLQQLNIPSPLYASLFSQLHRSYVRREGEVCVDDDDALLSLDHDNLVLASYQNFTSLSVDTSDYGCMLVLPHVCSWDVLDEPRRGLWNALQELPTSVLVGLRNGLRELWGERAGGGGDDDVNKEGNPDDLAASEEIFDRHDLMNQICDDRTWSRVILYRHNDRVRAALPAPPYPPQMELASESDDTEADLVGPFPFTYHTTLDGQEVQLECSLAYLNPGASLDMARLPTIDLVPAYSVPNSMTRAVRYVALLGDQAPLWCRAIVKESYAEFVKKMHLVRQNKLEQPRETKVETPTTDGEEAHQNTSNKVLKVYTDSDDPMELAHAEAGLTAPQFALTTSKEEADIIYSYKSLFGPEERHFLEEHPNILINQFPFEGALVQKDHLARETLHQHGLPRPRWSLETYDLDIQFTEFVGASVLAKERGEEPLWIIKPAHGTQSQGHVITSSTAHVLKLVDSGGGSRVAQRYIKNPVCYDGRKVDCRCIVMMTSASPPGRPTLYMHKRFYFRIARKEHSIKQPSDLLDHERVLTAMHLLDNTGTVDQKQENEVLPVDYKTIARLEADYKDEGFDWKALILPQIKEIVLDLINGMTMAYPKMGESKQSRALYGLDVMFEVDRESVTTKLTEVTFCPANNAICAAYERDDELFRNYNNDVFGCLFLDKQTDSIMKLQ